MHSRRSFIQGGLGAAALGLLRRSGFGYAGPGCVPSGGLPLGATSPFAEIPVSPDSIQIAGMPFAASFSGDAFADNSEIPFHFGTGECPGQGGPPRPQEEVEIAVVGGGISGLATAYMLREHRPVLFELHDRFGGSAQGEHWNGTHYSFGNAYVITPDKGTFLEEFYHELGLHEVVRVDDADSHIELSGRILDDFFDPETRPPEEVEAFERYRRLVRFMGEVSYPDIPLPDGKNNDWILELDQKTLKQHIEETIELPVPQVLASAIQAYCYSSFAAGWEEISAASGWNFLAAEEYGRWVFPGGNAYMASELWRRLSRLEVDTPAGCAPRHLRGRCVVQDVRLLGDKVQVTWRDSQGGCRSLLAKRVVLCCPKLAAKNMLHDLQSIDPAKNDAMYGLDYRAYVVANVLLDAPVGLDFYDTFLLGDGAFPTNQAEAEAHSRVTDMLNGHFARPDDLQTSVLTLYWPLPWDTSRWSILIETGLHDYAQAIAPQIRHMLGLLGVPRRAVKQVRLTRWGHALPIARPGFIAEGRAADLLRPIEDKIWFVNQDNWALPAVENSLLDAKSVTDQILAGI